MLEEEAQIIATDNLVWSLSTLENTHWASADKL
jgi:hypothetical protein